MVCIYCGSNTSIINSRLQKNSNQTWRRHKCQTCLATITSIEKPMLENIIVISKYDGATESFDEDKLFLSILKSTDHLNDPVKTTRALTSTVINLLTRHKPLKPKIKLQELEDCVIEVLKNYDAAASIKYLSYQKPLKLSNDVRKILKK